MAKLAAKVVSLPPPVGERQLHSLWEEIRQLTQELAEVRAQLACRELELRSERQRHEDAETRAEELHRQVMETMRAEE